MRKSAVLLILVFAVFMVVGIALVQSLMIVQRIAAISDIAGSVLVQKRGESDFRPIEAKTHVLAGSLVKTGPAGGVTLNWVDGSRLRMGPDTQLRVRKCLLNTSNHASVALFDLDVGTIWVRVMELVGERSKFEIKTPTATAGVRGTVFSVSVDADNQTSVSVYEGTVEVADASHGATATASAGQTVVASPTASTVQSSAMTDAQRRDWSTLSGFIGPRLDLDDPGPVAVSADATTVTVTGVAEPGAQITIENHPAALDRNNRFSQTVNVPADAAEFDIVVSATDHRGGKTEAVLSVTREH